MKWLTALLLAAALCVAHAAPSPAIVIRNSPGGLIADFVQRYQRIEAAGDHVVVEGMCASACTTMLGIIDRDRVCVTPGTWFGFHSAFDMDGKFSVDGTRWLWSLYPRDVQKELSARGWAGPWQPHPRIIRIEGSRLYHRC